jgi:hypothetical protein
MKVSANPKKIPMTPAHAREKNDSVTMESLQNENPRADSLLHDT